MACLLAYVAEMERAGGGEAGGGRAPVYATVAWASLLAAFSHVYFSTIVVLNNGDESTLVSYVFVYLQTVAKTALALERGALLGALSAALRGVLARLDALGAEVRAHGEAPQRMAAHAAAHAAALATARDVKRAYLRLQRLAARLHSHEGPALLLLLGGSVFRTFVCVYIATSAFYLHERLSATSLLTLCTALAWLLLELLKTAALLEPGHGAAAAKYVASATPAQEAAGRAAASAALSAARRGELRDELAGFLELFELCGVPRAPLGVCATSRSLLAAVAGGCGTFFVVVRQFHLQEDHLVS
ncbi:uncharacterized protein LOC128198758 isoform X2 [Bicyclus anynana]|uniref:Gustatory receptor n=1 Tax=Bicyclus anynana TaxID=110368 RepID=A0ABM3LR95_BICAN|nr:uncharacterized protein LOC128198758 isoform X2 [Bicyclus anynana]